MIETQQSSISYTADGVQTQWEFPYSYFSVDDIKLFITQDGTRTQIAAADYTFNVTTKKVTYPLTGDPVAAGSTVELTRQTDITQLEDSSIQNFKSNDVERIADKLTLISQDLKQEMADIVAPEGGAIAETVAAAVQASIAAHNASSNSHTGHLVAKTGSTMSGNLTMSNGSRAVFSNIANSSYNVFAHETSGGVKQLHLTDTTTGAGVLLDAANSNKPFYVDGSNAYRLLDTSDKTTLETAIAGKAATDLSNCTKPHVTETYTNSTSWYRVWSDGWCEQGGFHLGSSGIAAPTITFLKSFSAIKSVNAMILNADSTSYTPTIHIYSITNDDVQFSTRANGNGTQLDFYWEVKGYLAVEE